MEYIEKLNDLTSNFNKKDINEYYYTLTLFYLVIIDPEFINYKFYLINTLNKILMNYNDNELENNNTDITKTETFISIFYKIKKELSTSINISNNLQQEIENILIQLDQLTSNKVYFDNLSNDKGIYLSEESHPTLQVTTDIQPNLQALQQISQPNIPLQNINPNYLKDYLIHSNKIEYKCTICGLSIWQNNYLQLQLDYIDGNPLNQNPDNLRLLCPNCYSQIGHG